VRTRSSHEGRHRAPGRHRGPARPRRLAVSIGSGLRTIPLAVGAGVALVAAAPQVAPAPVTAVRPTMPEAMQLLAARDSADRAVSRTRARVAPRDLDADGEQGATEAPQVPEAAAPTPAPTAAPSTSPSVTKAASAVPSAAVPALALGSQFAGAARGIGLRGYAVTVYCAVRATFGISNIGGYRAGDSGDHGAGRAVDVMISGKAQGDAVAAFVIAHAAQFHVKYVIWRQRIWEPSRPYWRAMADRGSATANHYDHVHVSVTA